MPKKVRAPRGPPAAWQGPIDKDTKPHKPLTLNFPFQPDQASSKILSTEHPFRLIPGLENTPPPRVGRLDALRQPVGTQNLVGHLDDDVVHIQQA